MSFLKTLTLGVALMTPVVQAAETKMPAAFLEITLKVQPGNRAAAAEVYKKYKSPFLKSVPGAQTKQLLIRDDDVQVLHGFDTAAHAADYLKSSLFNHDVVGELKPLLEASPEVRIYTAN